MLKDCDACSLYKVKDDGEKDTTEKIKKDKTAMKRPAAAAASEDSDAQSKKVNAEKHAAKGEGDESSSDEGSAPPPSKKGIAAMSKKEIIEDGGADAKEKITPTLKGKRAATGSAPKSKAMAKPAEASEDS
eukprot:4846153-Pyramimonas_sp.AAC.1